MKPLKLRLVRNGDTIFEIPLCPTDWQRQDLADEFKAAEVDFERFSRMFDALSHRTRLRMMQHVVEEKTGTMSFADFMRDLDLNPKTVWENSRKLEQSGLLEKTSRGKYSCSDIGETAFMMMSLALRRLIQSLEEIEEVKE